MRPIAQMSSRRMIVAKLRPPPLASVLIPRPRLQEALAGAAGGHRVVLIIAGAGAGKTTAAARFLEARPGRTAWLSLDRSDTAAGRFVSYLAATVGQEEPRLESLVQDSLADGLLAEDCAGLLAERLGPGWTIVLDDLHHLEPDAPALVPLRAFLRYLPADALAVLVSRRMPSVDLFHGLLTDQLSGLFDDELAFSLDETQALLQAREVAVDPRAVHGATGGWAAGIVFEALRGPGRASAFRTTEGPLFSYLGDEILHGLTPRLRRALLRTAVLDTVTQERLERLLRERPPVMIDELARLHLPATAEPEGLRYHPQFREFLEYRLRRELPDEVPALLDSYGRLLAAEGFVEEAVDVLLQGGSRREAEALAERTVRALRRRGDWSKVLSWTEALGEEALRRRPVLREAQVRALLNARRQEELEDLVHEMLATGEVGELVESAPDVAAWAVWALHGSGEWAKLIPLLPPRGRSQVAEVMRYMLVSSVAREPPEDLAESALARTHPLHVVLQEALYFQGRLRAAGLLADVAAASAGPVTAAVAQVHKVNVLRARGDPAAARRVLETVPASIRSSRFIEFWLHAEAELVLEEGNGERALELIRSAREVSARHGWRVGDRAIFGAVEGRMLVRLGAAEDAMPVLAGVRAWCAQRGLASFREWAESWLGAAMLVLGRPAEEARALLAQAVAGMRRARRHLELPAAAVFLAEAEWRLGDAEAHDRAADAAYAAAEDCGTLHPLAGALELMPEVLARRLDAEPVDGERRWRTLVPRSPTAVAALATEGARLRVRTLGTPALELDGEPVANVPLKAVELAAEISHAGPPGVARSQLVSTLFEGSRDGPNYLRQLVFRLRRALPAELELRSSGTKLAWRPAESVAADDALLESLHGRVRVEVGQGLTETLERALALVERGQYMEGLDDESVIERRRVLAGTAMDVRLDYARAMRVAGAPGRALAVLTAAVDADPYREDAWQELMRVQAGLAGPAAVARVFLDCRRSLSEVGLEPSGETRVMLERLRG
jgi:ATP/maltotriose-dependent transcriptional regulator MalT/DNA-binding SARP family transcriptional activator